MCSIKITCKTKKYDAVLPLVIHYNYTYMQIHSLDTSLATPCEYWLGPPFSFSSIGRNHLEELKKIFEIQN